MSFKYVPLGPVQTQCVAGVMIIVQGRSVAEPRLFKTEGLSACSGTDFEDSESHGKVCVNGHYPWWKSRPLTDNENYPQLKSLFGQVEIGHFIHRVSSAMIFRFAVGKA
jgi:hypothetical protein